MQEAARLDIMASQTQRAQVGPAIPPYDLITIKQITQRTQFKDIIKISAKIVKA